MSGVYKTGDKCPITGYWLLEENDDEEMYIRRGDEFATFNLERAHYRLKHELPDDD